MTKEKQRKTNCRNNSRQTRSRDFEFEIGADDSSQQKQWCERCDPKGELLKAAGIQRNNVAFESRFLPKIDNRISDAICQQRFSVDPLCCLLPIQGQKRSLWMNQTIPDFHFLVFVHERFANIWIVAVTNGRAADERRPVGNGLIPFCSWKVFAGWQNRGCCANRAHWRHVDPLRAQRDQRTSRPRV